MEVLEKILTLLTENAVTFERIDHEAVYTSEQASQIRDTNLSMDAKALVCLADKNPILIVLPGDCKLDTKAFKKQFNIKDLRMASREEVAAYTGLQIGSIPPLGNVLDLKTYFDEKIREKGLVAFNAGSHKTSVKMQAVDLIKIVEPIFGTYAV